MGRETGGRFKREGIYVYLRIIHVEFDRKQQSSVKQLSFNRELMFFPLVKTARMTLKKRLSTGQEPQIHGASTY